MQVHPEALSEVFDVADWYDQRQPGRGGDFLEDFFATVDAITEFPLAAPRLETMDSIVGQRDFRRRVLQRFPYVVVYEVLSGEPVVLAVHHGRRRPHFWMDRLPEA